MTIGQYYLALFRLSREIYIVLFVSMFFQGALCQEQPMLFKHLTTDNGLKHSFIYSIVQDHQGFLWFASENGLHRFDGELMKAYLHNPSDSNSISGNTVFRLLEDNNRNFFVCTNEGFDIYDKRNERFKHIPALLNNGNSVDITYKLHIKSAAIDSNNNVYTSCLGYGIFKYDSISECLVKQDIIDYNKKDFDLKDITAMFVDTENTLWLGSKFRGLFRFYPDKEVTELFKSGALPDKINSSSVYSIGEDRHGNIIISTNNGLVMYNGKAFTLLNLYENEPIKPRYILAIHSDRKQNLWFCTNGGGLGKFIEKDSSLVTYIPDDYSDSSLNDKKVQCFYEDRQGNYWIGTEKGGVNYVINNKGYAFQSIKREKNKSNSLSLNAVSSIFKDSFGRLLIGTDGGGLNIYNPDKKTFLYSSNGHITREPGNEAILTITQDKDKNLWVGGYLTGFYMQTTDGRVRVFKNDPENQNSLSHNDVRYIIEDSFNNIWIATNGSGLNKYDKKQDSFIRFNPNDGNNSICSYNILVLYEDSSHYLWVGTYSGLSRINLTDGKIRNFTPNDGLNSDWIYAILQDWQGQIWIGTTKGLNLFNPETQRFSDETSKACLSDITICGLLEDNNKELWISTFNGLVRYNPQTGRSDSFFKSDGLAGNNFTHGTYYKDKDGILYFGTTEGLVYFDPSEIEKNKFSPPVYITNLYSDINPENKIVIEPGGKVKIGYREASSITINFVALNYSNPERNQYVVKLDGIDTTWRNIGNKRNITYTELAPGTYTFTVKASCNNNLLPPDSDSITISIAPPWWKSVWGLILLIFVSLIIVGGIKHYQILFIELLREKKFRIEILVKKITKGLKKEEINSEKRDITNAGNSFDKETEKSSFKSSKKPPHILVIEYNKKESEFLSELLSKDYVVHTANSGTEGLKQAKKHLPALVITEIFMPEEEGFEICRKLKNDFYTSHIPIIILTRLDSDKYKIKGLESGADDFMSKPYKQSVLHARIKNILESRIHLQKRSINDMKVQPSEFNLSDPDEIFLGKTIKIIEDNINLVEFDVTKLAEHLNVTTITLYRKLKALTGQSINQFIRSIRLKRAANLLETKKYTVQEVAFMVGFSDTKYFRKCFYKQFGTNPSKYEESKLS